MFVVEVYNTVSCGQSKRNIFSDCKEPIEQSFFFHMVSCSRFLTISKFLTQVASKSCISMQLFDPVQNLFDAVAEVCNTSWCYQTKQNVMKWGCGIDRKIIHLSHGVVVVNVDCTSIVSTSVDCTSVDTNVDCTSVDCTGVDCTRQMTAQALTAQASWLHKRWLHTR